MSIFIVVLNLLMAAGFGTFAVINRDRGRLGVATLDLLCTIGFAAVAVTQSWVAILATTACIIVDICAEVLA